MTDLRVVLLIATRNLLRNSTRTSVALLTVAFGVAAYLLAAGFIAYIVREMREATIHSHLGHIQIVRPGYFEKGVADPFSYMLPHEGERRTEIEKAVTPQAVAPRLVFGGLISLGDATLSFLGEGIDPTAEVPVSSRVNILSGRELAPADRHLAILGEGLARSLEARPGDRVVLLVTSRGGTANAVELEVAGIFSTSTKEYDDYGLRLPIGSARTLLRTNGSTSWVTLLSNTQETEEAMLKLRGVLPESEFQLVSWTELADFYNKTVVLFSKQVGVVKVIIGLIIVLTIMNLQTMNVLERTAEIGTLLAIGSSKHSIMREFVAEGAVLGVAGGLVGVLFGLVFGWAVSAVGIPMPPPPGMAHGYIGRILLKSELAADGFVLAVLTTLIASLLPAWRASRMNVVDALRYGQ